MSDLLAMSFDMLTSPSITLKGNGTPGGGDMPFGWGMGWYPGDEVAAVVIKDPTSIGDSPMSQVLRDWERFRSSTFLCHLRGAAQRITQRDTHPFIRSFAGRQWLIAHNGDLHKGFEAALPLGDDPSYEPLGRTDTEHAFCWLLLQMLASGKRTLMEVGWPVVQGWLEHLNSLGELNLLLTDGQSLVVYHDKDGFNGLHWVRLVPPDLQTHLENADVAVDLNDVRDSNRTGLLFASQPLSGHAWVHMSPGQTLVSRRGSIVWDNLSIWDHDPVAEGEAPAPSIPTPPYPAAGSVFHQMPVQQTQGGPIGAGGAPSGQGPAPHGTTPSQPFVPSSPVVGSYTPRTPIEYTLEDRQTLSVLHETVYRYSQPVDYSTHLLRVRPVMDGRQVLPTFELDISVDGLRREYEDVFGNHAVRIELSQPYSELSIRTRAQVGVVAQPRLDLRSPFRRDQIPLVWMPWQRQMMLPYLLPAELPESELRELHEFAMSFVERNDYELLETLLDMNRTIFDDFDYVSGSTTLSTTPYDVYVSRRGVCQDFANLLICMARLLNVPARYRAGYIYTGGEYQNRMQSDASHAWAELYLPWIGWHGFDPTNGCLVAADHVRVACGRNYQDATPTSGTIFRGGGGEQLSVTVKVEKVS